MKNLLLLFFSFSCISINAMDHASSSLIDTALEHMHAHRSPSVEELENATEPLHKGIQSLSTSQSLLSQPLSTREYSQYLSTLCGELLRQESSHVPMLDEEKYCMAIAEKCLLAKPPLTKDAIAILYPLYTRHQQDSLGGVLILNLGFAYARANCPFSAGICITLAALHPQAPVTNFIAHQMSIKSEECQSPQ